MRMQYYFLLLISLLTLLFASGAYADPPNRVGRLSYIEGIVSLSPNTSPKYWIPAQINRVLVPGDKLWVDLKSRAEIQLGDASLRLRDDTSLRILSLNDLIAQFDIAQGALILNVRNFKTNQIYEIDTPQLAFQVLQPGKFRIDVAADGKSTTITVRSGKGLVFTKTGTYNISKAGTYRYIGSSFQQVALYKEDNFDKWSYERENRFSKSRSTQYVSSSLIGYEDLDYYGSWTYVKEYGYVWKPTSYTSNWAPYRYGHWTWVTPWGWTWVDDQPWGFATSHYGRWAYHRNSWVWVPGRKTQQASYAPALVAFFGGEGVQVSVSWFPLGPRDVYVPPYKVSQQYFTTINSNNTTINNTQINSVYNHTTVQNNYTYQQTPAAVTAVPTKAFVESKPVDKAAVAVKPTEITQAPVTTTPAVVPETTTPPATTTEAKPTDSTLDREAVVATPPETKADTTPVTTTEPAKAPEETPVTTTEPAPAPEEKPVDIITPPVTDEAQAAADAKAAADKASADKVQMEKEAAEAKAAADKAAADKAAMEKAAAESRAAEEKMKADQLAADKAELEKAAADAKSEADKAAAEKARMEKEAADAKAAADKAAADKAEMEKAAAQAEADKQAAEAQAKAKEEADRQAAEAQAKAEADRQAAAAAEEANKKAEELRRAQEAEQRMLEQQRAAEEAKARAEAQQAAQQDLRAKQQSQEADQKAKRAAEEADRAAQAKAAADDAKAEADRAVTP